MRSILVFMVLLISCYGKEYPEETADLFKSKLWQEIQKRLFEKGQDGEGQDGDALHGLKSAINEVVSETKARDPAECPQGSPNMQKAVMENTIIKTTDSVHNGAQFLASPKVETAGECLDKCCQTSRCTLAVYENKRINACYLFACGTPSNCKFTEHANYTSIVFEPVPRQQVRTTVAPEEENDKHEDELQGLVNNKPQTVQPTVYQQPPRTTPPPPPPPETTKAPVVPTTTVQRVVQVKLFASCSQYEVCEDENSECSLEQFCVCKDGFIPKNGRCANKGQENNKPGPTETGREQQGQPVQPVVETGPDEPKMPQTPRPHVVAVPVTQPLPTRLSQHFIHHDQSFNDNKDKEQQPIPNTGHAEVQSHPDKTESQMIHPNQGKLDDRVRPKVRPQIPPRRKPIQIHPTVSKSKNIAPQGGSRDQKPDTKVTNQKESKPESPAVTEAAKTKPAAAVDLPADQNIQVQAHVKAPEDDSAGSFLLNGGSQGAIVALSLSLTITVILVLFLGCRLRTIKRRLKRGRVLTSNEADYLINGMYL